MEVTLGGFDFSKIEFSNSSDFVVWVDLGGGSALGSGEDDVD